MELRACTVALLVVKLSVSAAYAQANRVPGASGQLRETYVSATVDDNGNLAITAAGGGTIIVPKEGEQRSFGEPIVSADRRAVGVQAYYQNCCTSYDIPLQLVVFSNAKVHRFNGNSLPIFQWHFADGGTRVAFGQEPVHFGCEVHYELRDIESERLIESADVPQPCGLRPHPTPIPVPKWVEELKAARK